MKRINWNRVVVIWAIGSLIVLAASHGARASERNVISVDKNDYQPVFTAESPANREVQTKRR